MKHKPEAYVVTVKVFVTAPGPHYLRAVEHFVHGLAQAELVNESVSTDYGPIYVRGANASEVERISPTPEGDYRWLGAVEDQEKFESET